MKKSDYAIVLSCNPGYGFGMIATINAQNHFGTDADWEIAYEGYSEEERNAISNAFPFRVNWTPVSELTESVVDRRSDRREPLNRFWIAYWLLALKVLKEKKYKAVCVIQADVFVFVNLDAYFGLAEDGYILSSEYPFSGTLARGLPYGDDKAIWDRSQCGLFDAVNFIGAQYVDMIENIVSFQAEDAFRGEANHSVIALNRSVVKHAKKEMTVGLNGNLWVCDNLWGDFKIRLEGDKAFDDKGRRMCAWHNRWWAEGRSRSEIGTRKGQDSLVAILVHNYNLVKSFMERFNDMIPEIKSEIHVKGLICDQ